MSRESRDLQLSDATGLDQPEIGPPPGTLAPSRHLTPKALVRGEGGCWDVEGSQVCRTISRGRRRSERRVEHALVARGKNVSVNHPFIKCG